MLIITILYVFIGLIIAYNSDKPQNTMDMWAAILLEIFWPLLVLGFLIIFFLDRKKAVPSDRGKATVGDIGKTV